MGAITEDILEALVDQILRPHKVFWGHFPKEYSRNSLQVAVRRLEKKGFIEKGIMEDELCLRLTRLGANYLKQMQQRKKEKGIMKINPVKIKWDGKWRVVVFDIPEKNRRVRQALRMGLRMLEFKPLQKSVWVSKVDCTRELRSYIRELSLSSYVLVFETKDLGTVHG